MDVLQFDPLETVFDPRLVLHVWHFQAAKMVSTTTSAAPTTTSTSTTTTGTMGPWGPRALGALGPCGHGLVVLMYFFAIGAMMQDGLL